MLVPGAGSTGAAVQSAVQGGCSSSMQHCSPHPQPAHCMLQLCGLCVSFDRNIFVRSKNNFSQVVVSGYTDGLKLVESEFNVP